MLNFVLILPLKCTYTISLKMRFFIRQIVRLGFISRYFANKALFTNSSDLEYRLLKKIDSISELTNLINAAYRENAEKGLNFLGASQDEKTTLKRIRKGICIVVVEKLSGRIVGTITFKAPHRSKGSPWFNKPYVAKRNLLAVDPEFQKRGIASHLIRLTEIIAKKHGATEIAFDTAESHQILLNFYKKNHYRFIENVKWGSTNYLSVIYSKRLV